MAFLSPDFVPRSWLLFLYPLCLLPVLISLLVGRSQQKRSTSGPPGCKKLGLTGASNLSDEYSTYPEGSTEEWRVKALFIHPIKSCAPVELDVADISATGLSWDRQFCFAEWTIPTYFPPGFPQSEKKKSRWVFCTLRGLGYEKLVHVRPEVWIPDAGYEASTGRSNPNPHGLLIVHYPNVPRGTFVKRVILLTGQLLGLIPYETSFRLPLTPPKNHTYPLESVSVWKEMPQALNLGRHLPPDFKAYLNVAHNRPLTLFGASPDHKREVFRNAPRKGTGEGQIPYQPVVAFSDSYPLHLLNLASVQDLSTKVRSAETTSTTSSTTTIPHLTARRFRPNILVTGPKAYDEDDWKRVRVTKPDPDSPSSSALDFFCTCHTLRCKLPNVDPVTGIRHPREPDRTLRKFRCVDPAEPHKAALGLQLVPARMGAGKKDEDEDEGKMMVRVGDRIEVLERGEREPYIKGF